MVPIRAGYLRSQAYAVRCHGDDREVKAFRVWSPKVLCGIGELWSNLCFQPNRIPDQDCLACPAIPYSASR